ncbi:MAG: hypothetical protein SLAVMIC_00342 [uncultured marine phage]|uniref:Uncharacterized protein n=1 Tax=uncultured marine phage TaxID=707152 RepID=A0A8D9FR00_9VIRU|nr:MAG: hypothetical protein SLAVMIC_00342 [uncultured marine phage]
MFIVALYSYIGRFIFTLFHILVLPITSTIYTITEKSHYSEKIFYILIGNPLIWISLPFEFINQFTFNFDIDMVSRMWLTWDKISTFLYGEDVVVWEED